MLTGDTSVNATATCPSALTVDHETLLAAAKAKYRRAAAAAPPLTSMVLPAHPISKRSFWWTTTSSTSSTPPTTFYAPQPIPADPACPIALIADQQFVSRFGGESFAGTYLLSLFHDVQLLYQRELNMSLPVIYLHLVNASDRSNSSSSMFGQGSYPNVHQFLYAAGNATATAATTTSLSPFPGFDKIAREVCLVHIVTMQNFNQTMGLAWQSDTPSAGICAPAGYNVGVSTMQFYKRSVTRVTAVATIAHVRLI